MGATTSSAPLKLLRKVTRFITSSWFHENILVNGFIPLLKFFIFQVVLEDYAPPVTSIALVVLAQPSKCIQIAVGRASGCICTAVVDKEQDYQQEVSKSDAHLQAVSVKNFASL